jgi:hypothetical protein
MGIVYASPLVPIIIAQHEVDWEVVADQLPAAVSTPVVADGATTRWRHQAFSLIE